MWLDTPGRVGWLLSDFEWWRSGWIQNTGPSAAPVSTLHAFFPSPESVPAEMPLRDRGAGESGRLWHALLRSFKVPSRLADGPLCCVELEAASAPLESRGRPAPTRLANLTWLILPVVICLSQRLSHACLSISFLLRNCEWLIITVIIS